MATLAHANKATRFRVTECPCGWGRHCRCLEGRRRFWGSVLVEQMRALQASGADLVKRRRALAAMRETVAAYDQHDRDTEALRVLYRLLPRQKDIDLVQRITCDDLRDPQTDEEIAIGTRTPVEHVRALRAHVLAAYEGRPLPVPREWRRAAAERQARRAAGARARRAA